MVLIEARRRGPETNGLRFTQRAADEDLGHHDVLVLHRVMLADPELAEPQLLGLDDQFKVFIQSFGTRLGRRMKGHDEHAIPDRLPGAGGHEGRSLKVWETRASVTSVRWSVATGQRAACGQRRSLGVSRLIAAASHQIYSGGVRCASRSGAFDKSTDARRRAG